MAAMESRVQGVRRGERSDAIANRRRILKAAAEVFARRGLAAEVREIAEQAGVGIGTLYRHFGGRDGLLEAVVRLTQEDMLRRLRAAVEAREPLAAFMGVIYAGAEACERFGALSEAVFAGRLGGHTEFKELIADILRCGMQEGVFRPDLDVPLVIAVLEAVFTSGMFLRLSQERSSLSAAGALADFFKRAVVKEKGG